MRAKFLDLDDLLDNNKKVYVRNNSLKSHLFIVIEMKDKSGRSKPLRVPPISTPICVSEQFSKDVIRESEDLRQCLHKGNLVLVDPEDAQKLLQTPQAQEELKALTMSVYADSAPANAVRDSVNKLKNKSGVVEAQELLNKKVTSDDISNRVRGVIASFQSKEKSSKDTLSALRRLKPTLTENDLTYILSECKTETTIREFAEGSLAELSAQPERPFEE